MLYVIQRCALADGSTEVDKNHFYERPQSIVQKISRKNLTILLPYLNAKV